MLTKETKTAAPKPYTEDTLNLAMKNIGRNVSDPKLRKLLRDSEGLGTPATRGTVIETLMEREYIENKKGIFCSTPKGRDIIKYVPKFLSSPETTALWEDYLVKMCSEKDDNVAISMRDKFVQKQIGNIEDLIGQLMSHYNGKLGEKIKASATKVTPKMKELIKLIAERKNIAIPKGALSDPNVASAFLNEHAGQIGGPPTEKQLQMVKKIEPNLPGGVAIPKEVFEDKKACSDFIDKYISMSPPSEAQVNYAKKIAEQAGVELPLEVTLNSSACSKFIDDNKVITPPTEPQLNLARKLAQEANINLPDGVEKNVEECSKFIKAHIGTKSKSGTKGKSPSGARRRR